ncbi:dinucleotide-utilizing enzyme [Pseudozyma hubeiensis SY62]|uniref:Dinucleotide-utilizing enzyme n=1 Tax=Pseudozyma hubeiensis (strain SY62) TaxID=1305764 RepID=R9P6E4_PSEHS|nr:dinucleotide-utilizing enzyme [Pseudozyma hubeiensis SY62]GAC96894.1 dinucleotide-utilizing enzyme [Pseudozyma hubeiensis SY62]
MASAASADETGPRSGLGIPQPQSAMILIVGLRLDSGIGRAARCKGPFLLRASLRLSKKYCNCSARQRLDQFQFQILYSLRRSAKLSPLGCGCRSSIVTASGRVALHSLHCAVLCRVESYAGPESDFASLRIASSTRICIPLHRQHRQQHHHHHHRLLYTLKYRNTKLRSRRTSCTLALSNCAAITAKRSLSISISIRSNSDHIKYRNYRG